MDRLQGHCPVLFAGWGLFPLQSAVAWLFFPTPPFGPIKLDALMYHMAIGVFLAALALTLVIGLHIVAAMRDSDKIKRMA